MSDGHKAEDYGTGTTAVGVCFVPRLGAPIAAGIAAWEARRLSKRIEALVAEVARIAAALDESKVDRAFLESEAFQDIVIAALEVGRRTSNADKRTLIAAALIGAVSADRPKELDIESLVDALGQLTPGDFRLLRLLHDEVISDSNPSVVNSAVGPADFPDRQVHLKRLEGAGLIYERSGAIYGYEGGEYFLTPTFNRFLELLALTATPEP